MWKGVITTLWVIDMNGAKSCSKLSREGFGVTISNWYQTALSKLIIATCKCLRSFDRFCDLNDSCVAAGEKVRLLLKMEVNLFIITIVIFAVFFFFFFRTVSSYLVWSVNSHYSQFLLRNIHKALGSLHILLHNAISPNRKQCDQQMQSTKLFWVRQIQSKT